MTQPGNVLLPPTITLSLSLLLLLLSSLRYSWGEDDEDAAYVTYEGRRINNHSYVDVSLMNNASSVQCHSHLHTCCSAQQGGDRGDWYSPSGEQLKFLTPSVKGEFQTRLPQRVELRCTTRNVCVSGLYRCGIMIHYPQIRRVRRIIYVGLYGDAEGGELSIPYGVSFAMVTGNVQFTLTCISTGGPATTVTWTRDSIPLSSGVTLLVDQSLARYTHTLAASEQGLYTCQVSNDKPSIATAQILVKAPTPPTIINISQRGRGSVQVTWSRSSSDNVVVIGYLITFNLIATGDTVSIATGAIETSCYITGLTPGVTYSITVRASSHTLPSNPSEVVQIALEEEPEEAGEIVRPERVWFWWMWLQLGAVGVALVCLYRMCGSALIRKSSIVRNCCTR